MYENGRTGHGVLELRRMSSGLKRHARRTLKGLK